eukprot:4524537-Amphidinium_carterae.1
MTEHGFRAAKQREKHTHRMLIRNLVHSAQRCVQCVTPLRRVHHDHHLSKAAGTLGNLTTLLTVVTARRSWRHIQHREGTRSVVVEHCGGKRSLMGTSSTRFKKGQSCLAAPPSKTHHDHAFHAYGPNLMSRSILLH